MKFAVILGLLLAGAMLAAPVAAEDRGVTLLGAAASPSTVSAGNSVDLAFTIFNYGQRAMRTAGPLPGFLYPQSASYERSGYPSEPGAFRVAVAVLEKSQAAYPYRWGLAAPLSPGQKAVVYGRIQLDEPGTYHLQASLEYSGRILASTVTPLTVTVLPKGVKPPPEAEPEVEAEEEAPVQEAPVEQSPEAYLPMNGPPTYMMPAPTSAEAAPYLPVTPRIVQVIYGLNTYTFYVLGPSSVFRPAYEQIPIPLGGRIPISGQPPVDFAALAAMSNADLTVFVITP